MVLETLKITELDACLIGLLIVDLAYLVLHQVEPMRRRVNG